MVIQMEVWRVALPAMPAVAVLTEIPPITTRTLAVAAVRTVAPVVSAVIPGTATLSPVVMAARQSRSLSIEWYWAAAVAQAHETIRPDLKAAAAAAVEWLLSAPAQSAAQALFQLMARTASALKMMAAAVVELEAASWWLRTAVLSQPLPCERTEVAARMRGRLKRRTELPAKDMDRAAVAAAASLLTHQVPLHRSPEARMELRRLRVTRTAQPLAHPATPLPSRRAMCLAQVSEQCACRC